MHNESDHRKVETPRCGNFFPAFTARLSLEARLNGKITDRFEDQCHTWNRNFWNHLMMITGWGPGVITNFGAGYLSIKKRDAAVTALNAGQYYNFTPGPVNIKDYGLIVGRGSGAEDFEGYELTTPITHGTGANQLTHRVEQATTQAYVAGTKTWTLTKSRLFENTSGNTIIVTETGIACQNSGTGHFAMFCRDLLGSSVNVLNNGVLTVSYGISLTFPA